MNDSISKLKELLTQNYKMVIKTNNNMSNPNERSPLVIQLISPEGEKKELTFRDSEIDIVQCLVYQFN